MAGFGQTPYPLLTDMVYKRNFEIASSLWFLANEVSIFFKSTRTEHVFYFCWLAITDW
jgi:hypothetical protein